MLISKKNEGPQLFSGERPGDLGIGLRWSPSKNLEIFRVVLKFMPQAREVHTFSYTFEPSYDRPFFQSLEMPHEIRELFRGRKRVEKGTLKIEWIGTENFSSQYSFSEIIDAYLGKRKKADTSLMLRKPIVTDSKKLGEIPNSELKNHSDAVRKALEEKMAKEKAEQAAKEALREAQLKKAREAEAAKKAPVDKAAAKPSPDSASISGGRVALIYGTTTGNTGQIADLLKQELGGSIDHVKNITDITPKDLTVCEVMILGVPTWHIGEMQDDWASFLPSVKEVDLKGKKVAIFGLGDGKGYPDTYVDAMQELWEVFEKRGATLYGLWPTKGYDFKASKALKDGKFLGLVIDVENQHEQSESRVKGWALQLKKELSL